MLTPREYKGQNVAELCRGVAPMYLSTWVRNLEDAGAAALNSASGATTPKGRARLFTQNSKYNCVIEEKDVIIGSDH